MSTRAPSQIQQLYVFVCVASVAWLALVGRASAQIAVTGTNQTGSVPLTPTWTATSDSLISGLAPTTATGNFGEYTHGNAANLTKPGNPLTIYAYSNPQATNLAVCGNDGTAGSLLVYTLQASTYGYNLTNITVYGGWQDAGRDAQAYTVSYSTVDNPTSFVVLTSVRYIPSNPSSTGDTTRVVINDTTGAAIANNVAALKFDFTTPNGGSRENGGVGYTAITVAGAAATSIIPVPQPIFGSSPVAEPYSYVKSGSFSGPEVPLSPDPLVAYRWPNPQASDDLQVYLQKPISVTASAAASFGNLQSLTGNAPNVAVNGLRFIRMDFGQENAAWLEFDSPDLPNSSAVQMSISEYNEPAVVNSGPAHPVKTAAPVKYGNTYRLELNSAWYEGARFGWIHVNSFTTAWHITGIRLVCQTRPANYNGSFSCSDPMLTRIWYAGAYGVKLNLTKDYFGAILMDRGDRISWTGDAHPSQAAALVAFGNDDFIRKNIDNTSGQSNGIKSYSLYWVLSLIDYYNYTGDAATVQTYIANACAKLDDAFGVYGTHPTLGFYGWDDKGRKVAVDLFDESTLRLIAPTKVVKDLRGGKYLVYSYDKSARFRIYHVRGDNAVLSGMWQQHLQPRLKRWCDLIHGHGLKVFYHTDGAARPLLKSILDCGVDVLNPIQHACPGMNTAELKKEFGQRVVFHGGVDNQSVLPRGTADEVRRETRDCLATLGAGKQGFICCSCHNTQPGTPLENILAMIETVQQS